MDVFVIDEYFNNTWNSRLQQKEKIYSLSIYKLSAGNITGGFVVSYIILFKMKINRENHNYTLLFEMKYDIINNI